MPTIFIHNLTITGTHGAHIPYAKSKEFKLNIEIDVGDIARAVATDDIATVYDYRIAVRIAEKIIKGPPVHLIETLVSKITEEILKDSRVEKIKLTLWKREFADTFDSGISLEKRPS